MPAVHNEHLCGTSAEHRHTTGRYESEKMTVRCKKTRRVQNPARRTAHRYGNDRNGGGIIASCDSISYSLKVKKKIKKAES